MFRRVQPSGGAHPLGCVPANPGHPEGASRSTAEGEGMGVVEKYPIRSTPLFHSEPPFPWGPRDCTGESSKRASVRISGRRHNRHAHDILSPRVHAPCRSPAFVGFALGRSPILREQINLGSLNRVSRKSQAPTIFVQYSTVGVIPLLESFPPPSCGVNLSLLSACRFVIFRLARWRFSGAASAFTRTWASSSP